MYTFIIAYLLYKSRLKWTPFKSNKSITILVVARSAHQHMLGHDLHDDDDGGGGDDAFNL